MAVNKQRAGVWSYGSSSIISTLLFVGILVFIALIAENNPWRMDLSESGKYSLSDQTIKILKALNQPVDIKCFFPSATAEEQQARDLLEVYRYHNDKITFEFIDPDRRPEMARLYEIRNNGTLVVEGFGKKQSVQTTDEQSITNAIFKLTISAKKKICFLTGHGERSLEGQEKDGLSMAGSALEKENYQVEGLSLMQQKSVPSDTAVLIIAGPRKPLFGEELERLESYVKTGGRVLVFLDPFNDGGLKGLLQSHGIILNDDIIVDESVGLFSGNYLMPIAARYGSHRITRDFPFVTFYPEARSLLPMEKVPEGIHVESLVQTTPDAWGETDEKMLREGKAGFDEKQDHTGPLDIALIAEIDAKQSENTDGAVRDEQAPQQKVPDEKRADDAKKGYLLAVGDVDFISNTYFGTSGNGDLFLNMANFLGSQETLITIERPEKAAHPMMLTQSQSGVIAWMVFAVVPLTVLGFGLLVYRVRRGQR